ncbi:MAG: DUF2799 domain-containing protein [Pseudomonadota bacterium]
MRLLVVLFGFALVLSGCATLSEDECQLADWNARGIADGQNGETPARFQRYTEACNRFGIAPDFAAWEAGRKTGLKTFCTPQGIYSAGLRRRGDPGQCGFDPELNRIHRTTSRYAELEVALTSARRAYESVLSGFEWDRRNIRNMRRRLARDDLGKDERKRAERSLRNSLNDLDTYPFRERQARSRMRELEFAFDDARLELRLLERELGFGSGSDIRRRQRFDPLF